ncbi:MAG: hypothetical protein LKM39_11460 [Chiayiivirga sp.]|jgi:hypothetical protein|nr:hypothetical protein [Chiayiivirga sp.]
MDEEDEIQPMQAFTLRGSIPAWRVAPDVNPATGLPLVDDSLVDVAGNPYGQDLSQHPVIEESPSLDPWSLDSAWF